MTDERREFLAIKTAIERKKREVEFLQLFASDLNYWFEKARATRDEKLSLSIIASLEDLKKEMQDLLEGEDSLISLQKQLDDFLEKQKNK